jgi:hypothetical protein
MRFNAIKKMLPEGCHIENRMGSQQQSIAYCKKDNEYEEFGSLKIVGRLTRTELKNLVLSGERLSTIVNNNDVSFNDIKFIKAIKEFEAEPDVNKPEVIWIHGSPGSGKTTHAYKLAGVDQFSKDKTKWWDGYDKQRCIVLNDWRPSEYWTADTTLRILGGEPQRIETKGSSRWIKFCERIIITCCEKPETLWKRNHNDEQIQQLLRRIDKVIDMDQSPWIKMDHGSGLGNTNTKPNLDP